MIERDYARNRQLDVLKRFATNAFCSSSIVLSQEPLTPKIADGNARNPYASIGGLGSRLSKASPTALTGNRAKSRSVIQSVLAPSLPAYRRTDCHVRLLRLFWH